MANRSPTQIIIAGTVVILVGILTAAGADLYAYIKSSLIFPPTNIQSAISTIAILVGVGVVIYGVRSLRGDRQIRKHPEFIAELERLIEKIRKVLYERSADNPSLRLQGEEVMRVLSQGSLDSEYVPYAEKVNMLSEAFTPIYNRTAKHMRGRPWTTWEFVDVLREISTHLSLLNHVFPTIYRQALKYCRSPGQNRPLPAQAVESWEQFRAAYNRALEEWKTFTERFDTMIGYGTKTKAELAKQLPC